MSQVRILQDAPLSLCVAILQEGNAVKRGQDSFEGNGLFKKATFLVPFAEKMRRVWCSFCRFLQEKIIGKIFTMRVAKRLWLIFALLYAGLLWNQRKSVLGPHYPVIHSINELVPIVKELQKEGPVAVFCEINDILLRPDHPFLTEENKRAHKDIFVEMTSHVSSPQDLIAFLDTSCPQVLVEPEAPEVLCRLQEEGVTCIGFAISASKRGYRANQDWWIAECARNGLRFSEVEIPYYSWLCRSGIYITYPHEVRTRDFPISWFLPPQRFLRYTVIFLSQSEAA
ncbi:MAG: hypothetical protein LBF76_01205, partial [Holosporales bacterium]|nr:hypothetical protein [Holosporales bacterium]